MQLLPLACVFIALIVRTALSAPDAKDPPTDWSQKSPDEWVKMLQTADAPTRRTAMRSLQRPDAGARAAALREPLLQAMAHDADPSVRVQAASTVGQHNVDLHADEELKAIAPFLAGLLGGKDAELRKEALYAIRQMGPH